LSWQTGLTFSNLTTGQTYYVYARSRENDNFNAGVPSLSVPIIAEIKTSSGEIIIAKPLNAWMRYGLLHVNGLTPGKVWSVYNVSGMLVYHAIAQDEEADISLRAQGVYIIHSEGRTVKIVFSD